MQRIDSMPSHRRDQSCIAYCSCCAACLHIVEIMTIEQESFRSCIQNEVARETINSCLHDDQLTHKRERHIDCIDFIYGSKRKGYEA